MSGSSLPRPHAWFSRLLWTTWRPPARWAVLYLASVPFFGLIYAFALPQHFYAQNVRLEPASQQDAERIGALLKPTLVSAAVANAVDATQLSDRLIVDHVGSFEPDSLTFHVTLMPRGSLDLMEATMQMRALPHGSTLIARPKPPHAPAEPPPDILRQGYVQPWLLTCKDTLARELSSADNQTGECPLMRVLTTQAVEGAPDSAGAVELNKDQLADIDRFIRGQNGDPASVSDRLGRFLYFSAMVITTVGMGDIVPLTPIARFVVTLEAIAGIVFAGLFVSAVANAAISRGVAASPAAASEPTAPSPEATVQVSTVATTSSHTRS